MLTVPSVVKEIIEETPFLEEALSKDLLNISSLARQIRPEVEERTMKEVQIGSIIMALQRLSNTSIQPFTLPKGKSPDLIVRSNLFEVTISNSEAIFQKQKKLYEQSRVHTGSFFTITHGVFETTVIASNDIQKQIDDFVKDEQIISRLEHLASITVKFSYDIVEMPGIYYMILKSLAWGGITITEVVSTYSEFTIILRDDQVDRAFTLIKKMFH